MKCVKAKSVRNIFATAINCMDESAICNGLAWKQVEI